jgi:hypothetical protein
VGGNREGKDGERGSGHVRLCNGASQV